MQTRITTKINMILPTVVRKVLILTLKISIKVDNISITTANTSPAPKTRIRNFHLFSLLTLELLE